MSDAYLVMRDGRVFTGKSFGAIGETEGEVVFNTSMTGYQEILTDPSYEGQIVSMTYPLIGNVGVNDEDVESREPFVRGFIVKEESVIASNWRHQKPLGTYLKENGIVGIQGIDTRALTRHIREKGAMPGIVNSEGGEIEAIKRRASGLTGLDGIDCVKRVTCVDAYQWRGGLWEVESGFAQGYVKPKFKVVAIDLGIKQNILRNFENIGAEVTVVPATTSADEILSRDPDGVFLSNGPGDPSAVTYAIETVKNLIGVKPVFGICLGHQIICLALGSRTYKLKFGHHGANHPVMDLSTKKVEITSQNHNFAVNPDSLPGDLKLTHINLNDRTVEGVKSRTMAVFSVQYHPEASPGPHDSSYLFARFADMMNAASCKQTDA